MKIVGIIDIYHQSLDENYPLLVSPVYEIEDEYYIVYSYKRIDSLFHNLENEVDDRIIAEEIEAYLNYKKSPNFYVPLFMTGNYGVEGQSLKKIASSKLELLALNYRSLKEYKNVDIEEECLDKYDRVLAILLDSDTLSIGTEKYLFTKNKDRLTSFGDFKELRFKLSVLENLKEYLTAKNMLTSVLDSCSAIDKEKIKEKQRKLTMKDKIYRMVKHE